MKTYARLVNGIVAELLTTAANPAQLFYPTLQWIDVTSQSGIQVGYIQSGAGFTAPPAPTPVVIQTPSLAQLQSELSALSAQIAALAPST
jgi:hypothetical protein